MVYPMRYASSWGDQDGTIIATILALSCRGKMASAGRKSVDPAACYPAPDAIIKGCSFPPHTLSVQSGAKVTHASVPRGGVSFLLSLLVALCSTLRPTDCIGLTAVRVGESAAPRSPRLYTQRELRELRVQARHVKSAQE